MNDQKSSQENENREKNTEQEVSPYLQKIKAILSLFDYKNIKHQAVLYGGVLVIACLVGSLSALQIRGSYVHLMQLLWISIGWLIPLSISIFILWKVKVQETTRFALIDFIISLFLFMVIAVLLQWGFYKLGYAFFGKRDFRNAIALCTGAEEWGKKQYEGVEFERIKIPLSEINVSANFLGNIAPPEILRYQKSRSTFDQFDIEHMETNSFFYCRFTDPRKPRKGGADIYTYDYLNKLWRQGI